MVKSNVIREYLFQNLTANANGLLEAYSDQSINGLIHSISLGSNTYANTGSLLIFASGTDNVAFNDLILNLRAGSMMKTFYPVQLGTYLNGVLTGAGSSAYVYNAVNGPLRVVGSGLGNGTSGLIITVRYQ